MKYLIFLFCICSSTFLFAQNENPIISEIQIEGNKKTKTKIILRELDLRLGDTMILADIEAILKRNEARVLTSGLFRDVEFTVKNQTKTTIELLLKVEEDWYIYPIPVFELADRNFNVWWVEYQRSRKRVNYGMYFTHTNLTGQRDQLLLTALGGYTQKLNAEYTVPYINKHQNLGIKLDVLYARNLEVAQTTTENKLVFERNDDAFLLERFRTTFGLRYRPFIKYFHDLDILYYNNRIDESITDLNPDFFQNSATQQQYFSIKYNFLYDNRDFRAYPMKGNFALFQLQKDGLGIFKDINTFSLTGTYGQYISFSEKWSTELIAKARYMPFTTSVPYYNSRALGYELDYLRGYEYYVIDGTNYAYGKASLRFLFLDKTFNLGKIMLLPPFRKFPLKVLATVNTDHGYVNNPYYSDTNDFSNRYLRSFGVGLDFILYQTRTLKLEYSVNHLGEGGFYIHYNMFVNY